MGYRFYSTCFYPGARTEAAEGAALMVLKLQNKVAWSANHTFGYTTQGSLLRDSIAFKLLAAAFTFNGFPVHVNTMSHKNSDYGIQFMWVGSDADPDMGPTISFNGVAIPPVVNTGGYLGKSPIAIPGMSVISNVFQPTPKPDLLPLIRVAVAAKA